MRIFTLAAAFLFISSFAFAADFNGNWAGTFKTKDGQSMPMSFMFKADGNKLTGTDNGSKKNIKDGKIDGNKMSFTLEFEFGGSKYVFKYKGVLSGDQLDLSFTNTIAGKPGDPGAFSLKRAK
jgi:hypothetical protein